MPKRYDHTSMGGSAREFPPTEWTRILAGRRSEVVLTELCQRYWKPVYSYLRSMGLGNEQAKDLTQGFFTDKVLGQDLVQKADREKGRFRSFLLRSVHNYAVSTLRSSKTHTTLEAAADVGTATDDPEARFNRAWADDLLREVLTELEQECRSRDKLTHWQIFREWLLEPDTGASCAMNEICAKYGIADPSAAYHIIENVKRRFRALLRARLGQVADSEDEIDTEIREFLAIFSGRSAGV